MFPSSLLFLLQGKAITQGPHWSKYTSTTYVSHVHYQECDIFLGWKGDRQRVWMFKKPAQNMWSRQQVMGKPYINLGTICCIKHGLTFLCKLNVSENITNMYIWQQTVTSTFNKFIRIYALDDKEWNCHILCLQLAMIQKRGCSQGILTEELQAWLGMVISLWSGRQGSWKHQQY